MTKKNFRATEELTLAELERLASDFTSPKPGRRRQLHLTISYKAPPQATSSPEMQRVRTGLQRQGDRFDDPKVLPGGWEFFNNRISVDPIYKPGFVELEIWRDNADYIAKCVDGSYFTEYGQGDGRKTRMFFETIRALPFFYDGCDISLPSNRLAVAQLAGLQIGSAVLPAERVRIEHKSFLEDDFWTSSRWSRAINSGTKHVQAEFGYGHGNREPAVVDQFMSRAIGKMRRNDHLLMSTDNSDDKDQIEHSYSKLGQFLLNGLSFACRLKNLNVPDPTDFAYTSFYNRDLSRVEFILTSLCRQKFYQHYRIDLEHTVFDPSPFLAPTVTLEKGEIIECGWAYKMSESAWEVMVKRHGGVIKEKMPYRSPGGPSGLIFNFNHIQCAA